MSKFLNEEEYRSQYFKIKQLNSDDYDDFNLLQNLQPINSTNDLNKEYKDCDNDLEKENTLNCPNNTHSKSTNYFVSYDGYNSSKLVQDRRYFNKTVYEHKIKEATEKHRIAIQQNIPKTWASIVDQIEQESTELNNYCEYLVCKHSLNKKFLHSEIETNLEVLLQRQKQISLGKVTNEYERYVIAVPKFTRTEFHPKTPNKYRKCSRRAFDGLVKKWRRLLHAWDQNSIEFTNSNPIMLHKNSFESSDSSCSLSSELLKGELTD